MTTRTKPDPRTRDIDRPRYKIIDAVWAEIQRCEAELIAENVHPATMRIARVLGLKDDLVSYYRRVLDPQWQARLKPVAAKLTGFKPQGSRPTDFDIAVSIAKAMQAKHEDAELERAFRDKPDRPIEMRVSSSTERGKVYLWQTPTSNAFEFHQ